MRLKISLIDKLLRNSYAKKLRNFLGIKPSLDLIDYTSDSISVSDAFFWRTDNNYETIFKFSNLLSYFYNISNSNVKLVFFSKNNEFIKEHDILSPNNLSEILINKSFLNNIESYGVFYVFHETEQKLETIIRNSCYTGYSLKNNIPSMVHGNTITAKKKFYDKKIDYGIGGYSFLKKRSYTVQNNFELEQTEIMLVNPTKIEISVKVNEQIFTLKKGCSKLITIGKNKLIKVTSKCYLLRPIIFERKDDFINVYHG